MVTEKRACSHIDDEREGSLSKSPAEPRGKIKIWTIEKLIGKQNHLRHKILRGVKHSGISAASDPVTWVGSFYHKEIKNCRDAHLMIADLLTGFPFPRERLMYNDNTGKEVCSISPLC